MRGRAALESLVPSDFEVIRSEGSLLAIRRDSSARLRDLALNRSRIAGDGESAYRGRGQTQRGVVLAHAWYSAPKSCSR